VALSEQHDTDNAGRKKPVFSWDDLRNFLSMVIVIISGEMMLYNACRLLRPSD
jgi:hypothetical protein